MSEIYPPKEIIAADRPPRPSSLLSKSYRDRLIERGILGLYRWYVGRSQETRNWSAEKGFDWQKIRTDFTPQINQVLEGFFAVEQYVPDYTSKAVNLMRRSHGRSHFQLRWGSEEEKHADTWEYAVLFSRARTPAQLEDYKYQLRKPEWQLPWDDALHILVYTVFQERATQLNYLNLAKIAAGKSDIPILKNQADPILAQVALTIATDEAAHYNFFLECMRLHMYYHPVETLEAMQDVINNFSMPAAAIIPNWNEFAEAAYKSAIYGPRDYARDVVAVVFKQLGTPGRKALEDGIKKTREIPDEEGKMRTSAIWESFDPARLEEDVKRIYQKASEYEASFGLGAIDPLNFEKNPAWKP